MATATPPDTVPEKTHQRLIIKYNELHKRYRDLEQRHAKCERYMWEAYDKYKAAKEQVKNWQGYIDRRRSQDAGGIISVSPKDEPREKQRSPQRVTSSQTTDGELESSPLTELENGSDDEPEVVSVRSLKRKRGDSAGVMPPPVQIKQEPTSPDNPIDLASEDYSSPQARRQKPIRAETSDLDAFVEHLETPRKRKRQRAVSEEVFKPATLLPTTSSRSDGDLPEAFEPVVHIKTEPSMGVPHLDPAVTARDFAVQPARVTDRGAALHPLSVNIPATSARTPKQRKRVNEDARAKVALLSEDGDDRTSQVAKLGREHASKGHVSHRLTALLEERSPDRKALPKRSTLEMVKRERERETPHGRLEAGTTIKSPQQQLATFKLPRGLEKPPAPMLPEDEPLRCRPLGVLQLDDFKINPSYMGEGFAFADTFRGREQRRCLQGCTKPDCCGNAFRKAVEIGAAQGSKSDAQVLEEYLGPHWSQVIGAYSSDKRKDLLTQARASALANQHGKHRQAFERRSTPPGFWRTDMPTTQEEEEDRTRAQQMERQRVEERWREAMRDCGRWLFRDEQ